MAEERLICDTSWYKVSVPYDTATTKELDIEQWLSDSTRAGFWSMYMDHGSADYYISDPDVAFEFKMRWM